MEKTSPRIMIIAGETSGDMRAAGVVREIKAQRPDAALMGIGGPEMEKEGVALFAHIRDLAVVGFVEVIAHYSRIKQIYDQTLEEARKNRPDVVVLVDYPGFNLRLAADLKKMGLKIVYYVSPQVWAWKENRIKLIRKVTDRMLVFFEFEHELYARHQMKVDYVGHPLLDEIKINSGPEAIIKSLLLQENYVTIGLLPGSRPKEIEVHLPLLIKSAQLLLEKNRKRQFILFKAPEISFERISAFVPQDFPVKIIPHTYDALNATDACIIASGTATLETAILQKPMVVIYKTSILTWLIAKMFVKIPHIGLVNIVAGKRVVPECIQFAATPENIAKELEAIIGNRQAYQKVVDDLGKLKEMLGTCGASQRAAEVILEETD